MWGQECVSNCLVGLPKMRLLSKFYWGCGTVIYCFSVHFPLDDVAVSMMTGAILPILWLCYKIGYEVMF